MNSAEGSGLPKLPDQIIKDQFSCAIRTPRKFVVDTVTQLSDIRPYLTHSYLIDALKYSVDYGEYDAMMYLRQVLFIPACLDEYYRQEGLPRLRVSKRNMANIYGQIATLNPSQRDARSEEVNKRIADNNPWLSGDVGILTTLNHQDNMSDKVQLQGVRKTLTAFELYETQAIDPYPSSPEIDFGKTNTHVATEITPLISSQVVDRALLDVVLSKSSFINCTFDRMDSPIASFIDAIQVILDQPSYSLISAFISRGFMDQLSNVGTQDSKISEATLRSISNDIHKKAHEGVDTNRLLYDARNQITEENPHLMYGIKLLEAVLKLDELSDSNAIFHFYRSWRTQIENDYWERKFK